MHPEGQDSGFGYTGFVSEDRELCESALLLVRNGAYAYLHRPPEARVLGFLGVLCRDEFQLVLPQRAEKVRPGGSSCRHGATQRESERQPAAFDHYLMRNDGQRPDGRVRRDRQQSERLTFGKKRQFEPAASDRADKGGIA